MATQYQEESVFNMALAYLKRIDKLLTLCQHSAFTGDINGWSNHLRGVYRESSIKLTPEEKEDIEGNPKVKINIKKLTDDIIEKEEANFRNIYFLINNPAFKIEYRRVIMFLLDALEIKLRGMLQKKNMLLPSKDDPRRAITQR